MTAADDRPQAAEARRLLDAARHAPPGVGEWLGPYELLEEIGRGGHSAVFRARQRAPVARELAVKVLVDPSPSVNVAARFARERALAARIRNPGVVPLIDAGEAGPPGAAVPWFAMPLVEGDPIDRWCERGGASRATRLRVLELAARAVAAAHALGVVHRDLKPSNILVGGTVADPQVHVIDFGVAKLLDPEFGGGGEPLATRIGSVVGTPEFMSPEQANLESERIGPPSDVYALGLIACVLLGAGVPGAGGSSAHRAIVPMGERLRAAADREVPLVSALAADRTLRGEIDWIVAKACARDADARYANAGALADELARLREGQPIVAAPKDSGYAVSFALRKHRAKLVIGAGALVIVIATLGWTAARERARADAESSRRERLTQMLTHARQQLVPLTGKGRGDSVDPQQAVSMAESMHEMNRELLGIEADEAQQSALVLGHAYDRAGRLADGERVYREMLDITLRQADRKRDHAYMRYTLGGNLRRQGASRAAEARRLLEQAIADWGTLDKPPFARCEALLELAFVAGIEAKYDEQRALLGQGVACAEANSPPGHFRQREAWGFMGDFLREQRDFAAARRWYERALDGLDSNTSDTFTRAWMDAWRGEILWMTCEDARRSGQSADAAQLRSILERTKLRDPANARLPRWTAAIESHPG